MYFKEVAFKTGQFFFWPISPNRSFPSDPTGTIIYESTFCILNILFLTFAPKISS